MKEQTPFNLYLIELRKLQMDLGTAVLNNKEDKIQVCLKELDTLLCYGESRFYEEK